MRCISDRSTVADGPEKDLKRSERSDKRTQEETPSLIEAFYHAEHSTGDVGGASRLDAVERRQRYKDGCAAAIGNGRRAAAVVD